MRLKLGELMQWNTPESSGIGRVLLDFDGYPLTVDGRGRSSVVVVRWPTAQHEIVDSRKLSPYPSSPIPEPTK